jgi:putative oxidoreductase
MQAFNKLHNDDLGKLVLRLTVGGLMLFHGYSKLTAFSATVESLGGMLKAQGWPSFIAYGVFLGEVVAPLLILVGYFSRPAAIVLLFNMIVAVLMAHTNDFLKLQEKSGAWALEVQAFYFFGALAVLFLGSGKYSLSRGAGTWD